MAVFDTWGGARLICPLALWLDSWRFILDVGEPGSRLGGDIRHPVILGTFTPFVYLVGCVCL